MVTSFLVSGLLVSGGPRVAGLNFSNPIPQI